MNKRNVLLLGSGGREHALAKKMMESKSLGSLYIAPGNAGTASLGENVTLDSQNTEALIAFLDEREIDLLVVGPEAPLVNGIADLLKDHSVQVIGPSKQGAMLEGSKSFAKDFMARHGIPTAKSIEITTQNLEEGLQHIESTNGPYVLKADGLAAGKGVLILDDAIEAKDALTDMIKAERFGEASKKVVIEQFLEGTEFSVFALTDGKSYVLLPEAKDYKRIGEGDTGLNTGGMGAVSPIPFFDKELRKKVLVDIVEPTINGLQAEAIDYRGFLYFGLIITADGPYVIEYNCRLGDPETQAVLARLQTDILDLFTAVGNNSLSNIEVEIDSRHAATIVAVSGGYPEAYKKGFKVSLPSADENQVIHYAGLAQNDRNLVTSGGRVLAVTSLASTLSQAVEQSKTLVNKVDFEGRYYRSDIGYEFL